jgi:hypothetical protein
MHGAPYRRAFRLGVSSRSACIGASRADSRRRRAWRSARLWLLLSKGIRIALPLESLANHAPAIEPYRVSFSCVKRKICLTHVLDASKVRITGAWCASLTRGKVMKIRFSRNGKLHFARIGRLCFSFYIAKPTPFEVTPRHVIGAAVFAWLAISTLIVVA